MHKQPTFLSLSKQALDLVTDRLVIGSAKADAGGCIECPCAKDKDGYGRIKIRKITMRAHRASYELFIGPIPAGLSVCHRCDNPSCINPSHLFLGDGADNTADMIAKNRHSHGSKHPSAKLRESDIRDIRRRSRRGETYEILSDEFGVNQATIGKIVLRQRWKFV